MCIKLAAYTRISKRGDGTCAARPISRTAPCWRWHRGPVRTAQNLQNKSICGWRYIASRALDRGKLPRRVRTLRSSLSSLTCPAVTIRLTARHSHDFTGPFPRCVPCPRSFVRAPRNSSMPWAARHRGRGSEPASKQVVPLAPNAKSLEWILKLAFNVGFFHEGITCAG